MPISDTGSSLFKVLEPFTVDDTVFLHQSSLTSIPRRSVSPPMHGPFRLPFLCYLCITFTVQQKSWSNDLNLKRSRKETAASSPSSTLQSVQCSKKGKGLEMPSSTLEVTQRKIRFDKRHIILPYYCIPSFKKKDKI